MARKVYLHIGLPKTGTTFLQTTMWHNRSRLREQGILYPGRHRLDHYNAFQQVRRTNATRDLSQDGAWRDLADELAAWDGLGLVSHEFFSLCSRRQIERLVSDLAPAEVHVVVTVRAYVRQFPAVWQEALKMTSDLTFDEFLEAAFNNKLTGAWGWATQDVPAVLDRWSSVVPAERVQVVTVPPPGGPRDRLWTRWCAALGIDDAGFDLAVSTPNESLGASQAALLGRVKPHLSGDLLKGPVRHRWVRRYFGHEVLVPQGGERFLPRPRHRRRLLRRSAKAVAAIEQRGYRVQGDLGDLLDPGASGPAPHPDDVTTDEMLDVASRAIAQMIQDVRELTRERDRWHAEWEALDRRRLTTRVRRLAGRVRPATPEEDR